MSATSASRPPDDSRAKRIADMKEIIEDVMIDNGARCLDDDTDRNAVVGALLAAMTRAGML